MKHTHLLIAVMMLLATIAGATAYYPDELPCETTVLDDSDVTNFFVEGKNLGSLQSSVMEGQLLEVGVFLQFRTGVPTEEFAIEVGLYPADSQAVQGILSTGIFSRNVGANPWRNCVDNEDFVQTDILSITSSADSPTISRNYALLAPVDYALNNGGTRDYVVQAVLYKNCYRLCYDDVGSQIIDVFTTPITLTNDPGKEAPVQSEDGVQNGDETDIDCGGSSGDDCPAGYGCADVDDCEDELICLEGGGGGTKFCGTNPPPSEDQEIDPTIMWFAGAILVVGLILLLKNKNKRR